MKPIITFLLLTITTIFQAQTTISGKVLDHKNQSIIGANVYLDGTYDGTSSNEKGEYSFTTSEKGVQTLVISFISFETYTKTANVSSFLNNTIKLREDINTLDAVEINSSSFEAGDNAKVTALKPLDIVTTASALGDVFGAFQTLPGTSNNEEDGRLFVRGGDANETQIFIDGVRVFNPFIATGANLPTRGRFSAFLFKGMSFSTGGYSAEYGQALSGVLALNTIDQPTQEKTDIQLMTVGAGVGNTQIWGKNSFSINTSYINLAPYQNLFANRDEWIKPYESLSGEMVYRHTPNDNGLLKLYASFGKSSLEVVQNNINFDDGYRFGLENNNIYFNGSYKHYLNNGWTVSGGIGYGYDESDIKLQEDKVKDTENSVHFKVKANKKFSNYFKLDFGAEYFITDFNEDYNAQDVGTFKYGFNNQVFGSFAEASVFFSKKLAMKIGVRGENTNVLDEFTVSPRASLAYKSGKSSQVSLAYGQFYQNPAKEYLKFSTDFSSESAAHFIANYQYVKNKQIFRVEGYYKKYNDLIKYDTDFSEPTSIYTNTGSGYAKGIDVFWRDGKNIKNLEYWMSYSYLDTERDYKNYPTQATPNFASKHNVSLVGKYWSEAWKTQFGLAYNFASGRSYTNPNKSGFLNEQTKTYNSVSLNAAYLIDQQKILYFSVNNVLGTENVYGYNYKNEPNVNGVYNRQAIVPNADQFFFIGFFWTISDDKKDNQLDNL